MNLIAPLYLAGLVALSLPWVLHRFNDARPEVKPFPSSRFLEPTAPPVSRRRKLRHRLLLALRVLALLALCALFAEPWISRPQALADARQLHVVAVDVSLSMRAGERFDRALDAARESLNAVPASDPVLLVSFARDVVQSSVEPASAMTAAAGLARLSPGYTAADYGRVMQRIDKLADESALPVRTILITDAQQSSLPERRNALFAPRLDSLQVIDVSEDESNGWLAADAMSENGATARVVVTVGSSDTVGGDRIVVVSHDARELARRDVRLEPGVSENIVFENITLPEVVAPRFRVEFAEGDDLVDDDGVEVDVRLDGTRLVALAAPSAPTQAAARVFVTTALEADGVARVDAGSLGTGQIPDDVPRLVAFAPFDEEGALPAVIERYVARGGGVLVVDGSAADPGAASPSIDGAAVGRIDESHALGLSDIDWRTTRFFGLGGYRPRPGDVILMATDDGRPILIERASDNGLLLLLNEHLDGVDSNLPFQPAFVDLMTRIVDWFDAGRAIPERVLAGDTVPLPVNVQVLDPEGRPLVSLADTSSPFDLVLDRPGRYTVASALGEQTLYVAIDRDESDLAGIDVDELAAWQARHQSGADFAGNDDDTQAERRTEVANAQRLALWPVLLPLLAILMLAETLSANRRLNVRRDGT